MRVLLLQESERDAELITNELASSGMTVTTLRVNSAESFSTALQSFAPDVVLSDHSLKHFDSCAALEILRSIRPTVPFIIVSGPLTGGQSVAAIPAVAEGSVFK